LNDKRKTWCWRDGLKLSIFPPSSPSWEQIKNKEKKKKKKPAKQKSRPNPKQSTYLKGLEAGRKRPN
jgi:hypothetical protein